MRSLRAFLRINLTVIGPAYWPALFPYVGALVAFILSPAEATAEFYSAAAQIIPVLLLVLAVELRFFRVDMPDLSAAAPPSGMDLASVQAWERRLRSSEVVRGIRTLISIGTLAILTLGEFVALHPLTQSDDAAGNPRWIYAALAAGLGAIAALSLLDTDGGSDRGGSADD